MFTGGPRIMIGDCDVFTGGPGVMICVIDVFTGGPRIMIWNRCQWTYCIWV